MSSAPDPVLAYISHEDFLSDVEAVADALEADDWRPDFLVGIGRGGLVPATYLSHRTAIPALSVDHSTREAGFADDLLVKLAAKSRIGQKILFVDDINDSGSTIAYLAAAIEAQGGAGQNVRFAVLINNVRSRVRSDYSSTQIDRHFDKRWFVFPWEAVAKKETIVKDAASVPDRLGG